VQLPPDTVIGYDIEEDRKRGFTVSENGIVVISKAESPESFSARQTRK
jgi:glucose-1-phosphate adenylyltransferase